MTVRIFCFYLLDVFNLVSMLIPHLTRETFNHIWLNELSLITKSAFNSSMSQSHVHHVLQGLPESLYIYIVNVT